MVLQKQGVFDAFLCVVDFGIIGISLCVVMYLGLPQYGSTALCDGVTPYGELFKQFQLCAILH